MLKKILLGAAILFIGFIIKIVRGGEGIHWEEITIFAVVALAAIALKEWTDIPYDWNKNKKKDKEDAG